METIFLNIEQHISSVISRKEISIEDNASTTKSHEQHIFYDLLEHLSLKNTDSRFQLYYYFHKYQECLFFSQTGSLNLAKLKLDHINKNLPFNMSMNENSSLKALYYPMKAYYHYTEKDYDLSLNLLNKSLEELLFLSKQNISEAKYAYHEQLLNICKVYFRSNREDLAIEKSSLLIKHLINDFGIALQEGSVSLNKAKESTHYYIGSIVTGVINSDLDSFSVMKAIFEKGTQSLSTNYPIQKHIKLQFRFIKMIRDTDNNEMLSEIQLNIETLKERPPIIQAIILGYLAVLSNTIDVGAFNKVKFCEFISKYVVESLKIKESLFQKIIKTIYTVNNP